jgi:uncharacterized protein (TIGR00730 family)
LKALELAAITIIITILESKMAKQKFKVEKAYKNIEFLNSPDARVVRLISEFLEPFRRFRQQGIRDTIVFFGSARVLPGSKARSNLRELMNALKRHPGRKPESVKAIQAAQSDLLMSRYYEDAVKLSALLTKWSKGLSQKNRLVMCSGGGPGIMEAANKGAKQAGGRSIGLNISLPFEQSSNPYIPRELIFEFHYFFMRKFWFVYLAKAMVMFPGGFGTFDELFEVLTLMQTHKLKKKVTIVLYGREHWEKTVNFENLLRLGLIGPEDIRLFKFADTPEEAYELIVRELRRNYPAETSEELP